MQSKEIKTIEELESILGSGQEAFLLIYKKGAAQSDCALQRLAGLDGTDGSQLLSVDVGQVKDIHPRFGITTAPSLLHFMNGQLKNVYKGCQTSSFYSSVLSGAGFSQAAASEGKKQKRVVVYTTPTCTWCNTLKTYFRENNVSFTEVDVASNPSRAEEMVRKSGQQGVPQTDIEGQMIIGFDKQRINDLLGLR